MLYLITGWWWLVAMNFIFPEILAMSSSQLTFIFFRGVAKNHQPVTIIIFPKLKIHESFSDCFRPTIVSPSINSPECENVDPTSRVPHHEWHPILRRHRRAGAESKSTCEVCHSLLQRGRDGTATGKAGWVWLPTSRWFACFRVRFKNIKTYVAWRKTDVFVNFYKLQTYIDKNILGKWMREESRTVRYSWVSPSILHAFLTHCSGIPALSEKGHHTPPKNNPQSYFLRRYHWIHRVYS